jgi:transcriptional regulator with XRE-family HTH domain
MLGMLIRKARADAKLTQEQLALRAHVDRSYLSEIERDVRHPTVQMLVRICQALGISAADMVRRVESQLPKKSR